MLLPRPPREGEEKGEGGLLRVCPLTLPLPAWGEGNSYSRTAIIFGSRLGVGSSNDVKRIWSNRISWSAKEMFDDLLIWRSDDF